jgi:Ca2+-binding RTX toxin-like protein
MLLPDLTPWVSQARGFVYDWDIQGSEIRLTTAMANVGDGRLELRGGAINGDTQQVYQRIYQDDGSFSDVLAGAFIYHSAHGHIHFEDFAEYRLREVLPDGGVGDVLTAGEKVSFCLLDVERYDGSGAASPHFLNCGQVQGISVGWADVYDRGLPGQSIDITGIADGQYWLEVVVDPLNQLLESDETNNSARILIDLQRPSGGGEIAADAFESNNDFANASILAPPEDHTYRDLSIHGSGNNDFFRVTASATGRLSFSLSFLHAAGDIDLEIYNSARTLLGRSQSVSNSEQISVDATVGEFYYVRVYGYSGAVNSNYTLIVDQADHHEGPRLPTTGNDDLVGTNNADRINLLAGDDTYQGLDGSDVISGNAGNDQLDGGAGADRMIGGAGNDSFIVDNTRDRVIERANQGLDTVLSSVTKNLAANVENLELTGMASINGSGNGLANAITGNSGSNILNGMTGHDFMTGGDGADQFAFTTRLNSATNVDTITDFEAGVDKIILENAIFKKVGAAGMLTADAFFVGAAANDTSDRIIYDDTTGKLYYDSNGAAAGGQVQFAVLDPGLTLQYTDIWIV